MVTIDQLTNLDTSKFTKAAGAWSSVSNRASSARTRVEHEILAKLGGTQKGEAATAVLHRLATVSKNYEYIHAECGLVRTVLSCLAEELAVSQRKLKQALEDAEALKFTVKPDGSVEYPRSPGTPLPQLQAPAAPNAMPPILKPEATADPNAAKAQAIANRIGDALKDATEIDGRYAKALAELTTDGNLKNTDRSDIARDTRDVQRAVGDHLSLSSIPKGKSAKANAEWWNKLSQEKKDEYIALFPAEIGALDGLPSTVRDNANRVVLDEAYLDANQKLKEIDAREPKKYEQKFNDMTGLPIEGEEQISQQWKFWAEDRKKLTDRLHAMEAIQARLDDTGEEGLPEAYLLGFSDKGLGRSIVANGNPDTADHTAVFVPGTTSKLEKSKEYIEHMTDLWKASQAKAPGQNVSTITWIGYDAPQSVVPEAMSRTYAWKAAPILNNFLDGLQTTQGGPGHSHTTVIGHSYGSTVVGAASIKGDLAANDIVVAGSPGMMVPHAKDLSVGADHVWSEAASLADDQVPAGGKLAGLGGQTDRLPFSKAIPFGYALTQNVPSDRDFGAHIMKNDAEGHGDYWRKGSVSLDNQANVVSGTMTG
ncbi:alpha/beta hydrolase [Streptomyces orinoci]|uniref:Alpha/beta hydrolase n=1 Tax=Streptomyces orinoci TaxID=67339 RepID=A0ABV3K9H2_STRON|nr:alpha/beta hydrolase [Streptomyces orinoci]